LVDSYRVALAEDGQLGAFAAIELAAATMFSTHDLPMNIRYRVTDMDTLREARRRRQLWVALTPDNLPVGFAYAIELDGQAHLEEMVVHPEHGRRGLGKRLLDAVRNWAKDHSHTELTLVTFSHLEWNAPYYATLGFVEIARNSRSEGIEARICEERLAGIDVKNRVAMRLAL
jgi:GNAT superfamily N-acetyltransferase